MRISHILILLVLVGSAGAQTSFPDLKTLSERQYWLKFFEDEVYGKAPELIRPRAVSVDEDTVFGGHAIRTLVTLECGTEGNSLPVDLVIYRPADVENPPLFLGYNFYGNHACYPDPAIPLARGWIRNNPALGVPENAATDDSRGSRSGFWPVESIVRRGYAVCTLYYGDIDPDFDDQFQNGVHGVYPQLDNPGSIAAWAWGLRVVANYLESLPWVEQMMVVGHSRLGKTALWAGAQDTRFKVVISNNSGCGGAALSKRRMGETLTDINTRFPHWFSKNFHRYNDKEHELPTDQHQLLACIAPRAVYVASAEADLWADPEGERLAVQRARPLFEAQGGFAGYHSRPGKHLVTPFDWERFMDFADVVLRTHSTESSF